MSTHTMVQGRQFRFDLTVEISLGVGMSSGELGELIADGLVNLEHRGLLFPGHGPKEAGDEWLLGTSIQCMGYERPAHVPAVDAAYARLMAPARPRRAKGTAKLAEDLCEARDDLGAAILRLRALQARLDGLAETLAQYPSAGPDASAAATVARSVATAILDTIGAEMKKLD